MLAVCDARRRFAYIAVKHPASASDYLAFATSSLYVDLIQNNPLPDGYCLYGDNAFINEQYMAVPFPNIGKGPKDDFNFFHSQVRINIECAFGILTNCWRILKSPLASTIPLNRVTALVSCLCRLHNYCINHGESKPPSRYHHDQLTLMDFADVTEENGDTRPIGLLGGGEHFDDVEGGRRGATVRAQRRQQRLNNDTPLPRTVMLEHVIKQDIHRPQPIGQKS
jgi:hypothetical protein